MIKKYEKSEPPSTEGAVPTRIERKQVEERIAITAHVVYETIRREGDEELHRPAAALAWSGLAAGLAMRLSFIAEALLSSFLPIRRTRAYTQGSTIGNETDELRPQRIRKLEE